MKDDHPPVSDFTAAMESCFGAKDIRFCQSIEWYAEGQTRVVDVGGIQITIRFVGRRGRRGRISITAPPGTRFSVPADEV